MDSGEFPLNRLDNLLLFDNKIVFKEHNLIADLITDLMDDLMTDFIDDLITDLNPRSTSPSYFLVTLPLTSNDI